MQKNETAAIEKSGEEQLNTAAESPEKEISAEAKPDKTNPVSADSSEKEPLKTADKISAIRSNLYRMAREEEEEEVSLRVAYQIKQVKARKEHPEKFPPPPPLEADFAGTAEKRTFRQKVRGLFPQKGDAGGEVARKCIFCFLPQFFWCAWF